MIFVKIRRDNGLAPWQMNRMKNLKNCLILFSGIVLLAGCGQTKPTAPEKEVAVISTTEGDMVIEFWTDAATNTVANFKKLAKAGFYDGTCFHRVIKGFMIQGGDPLTKDPSKEAAWGSGDPGYKIDAEFNDHPHVRGVISMARSADPNSAGCQFFICHGNPSFLDHQYTTFGKLIKGDDVLEKIATTPTHPQDRPDKRMGIISIKIVPAEFRQNVDQTLWMPTKSPSSKPPTAK